MPRQDHSEHLPFFHICILTQMWQSSIVSAHRGPTQVLCRTTLNICSHQWCSKFISSVIPSAYTSDHCRWFVLFMHAQYRAEKLTWCFWSGPGGESSAEYLCPVLRGMVGPLLSRDSWLSGTRVPVSSSFLIELTASFSTDCFLDLRSRCTVFESFPFFPSFPSLGLLQSFLLQFR